MLKCERCGSVREDDDVYRWTEEHGEPMTGCRCGGALEEARECLQCGEWFTADEDYDGSLCHPCARQLYTRSTGLAYVVENKLFAELSEDAYGVRVEGNQRATDALYSDFLYELERGTPWAAGGLRSFCLSDVAHWTGWLSRWAGAEHEDDMRTVS